MAITPDIVCNTRCMNSPLTGVQRYTQKILAGFPEKIETISPPPERSRGMKGHLWEQFILPSQINGKLLWSPSNSGPIKTRRQVVTIHDLVSVDHPEWFNKSYVRWYNYILPRLLKNADHIIAISEFTKTRIIDCFKIPESKITMIYNGADKLLKNTSSPKPDNMDSFTVPFKNYILSIGSLEPRKNIALLLRAWKNILDKVPDDVGLVIVGAKGNSKVFKDAGISDLPERVYLTGHIPDSNVIELYQNAMLFVYLSVYEGFGLPPLEAISAGLPVLTGNLTSLPEVVGDAGIMVDPYSLTEAESSLEKLINNRQLRETLSEKAIIQANKFNWQQCSNFTWDVLQSF